MTLRQLILEKVAELGEGMLDAFFPKKYSETRLWRNLLGTDRSYEFSKSTFSSILSQLREDGLVERLNSKRKAVWRITKEGLHHIEQHTSYHRPTKDGIMRVVSFDIPETQRKKRRWIREELLGLGYQLLQKSVWIGFAPLPEDFFEDLDLLELRDNIHIFSVTKEGTIREIK